MSLTESGWKVFISNKFISTQDTKTSTWTKRSSNEKKVTYL